MPRLCSILLLTLGAFAVSASAVDQRLAFLIPDLPASAVSSSVLGTTNEGQAVGVYYTASGDARKFVWLPEATATLPAGTHDAGPAVLLNSEHGAISDLGTWARAKWSKPAWANNWPQPVAAMWSPGAPQTTIGTLTGGRASMFRGLSDFEEAYGWSETALSDAHGNRIRHGIAWDSANGLSTIAPLPGFDHAACNGVSDDGATVVGTAYSLSVAITERDQPGREVRPVMSDSRGILVENGLAIDLSLALPITSGLDVTSAASISDLGWISGSVRGTDGVVRAAILVPNKADFKKDGTITPNDLVDFAGAFSSGLQSDDLDEDESIELGDVITFNTYYSSSQSGTISGATTTPSRPAQPAPIDDDCLFVIAITASNSSACQNCDEFSQQNPGKYDINCNPNCYGCDGCDDNNPNKPDGGPGWPGNDPKNPYAPNGGPGGNGCDETGNLGDGGDGGDGTEDGSGGDGGDGGPGEDGGDGGHGGPDDGNGGDGGDGGETIDSGDTGGAGGNGGNGNGEGDGGNGGAGGDGGIDGDGGNGGNGGNGGTGTPSGGTGGNGGNGGDGDGTGDGGNGGSGGSGGHGGSPGDAGGNGGDGGDGGTGGDDGSGGAGGSGGGGGGGQPGSNGGNGGDGGDGGNGGEGQGPGGDGGDGGNRDGNGGNGGNGSPNGADGEDD